MHTTSMDLEEYQSGTQRLVHGPPSFIKYSGVVFEADMLCHSSAMCAYFPAAELQYIQGSFVSSGLQLLPEIMY